ncbi:protein strawberry notch-like [Acropora millepora]|uniref:protein strawberry notch-like n=1 Tax=Acropora millepora TaxID=45264 RepID=UPI001CF2215F|nr:protein strawberry notch-like [Acropora millepora]
MSQLLNWCGHDFDGVIVLDECHKAKNLVPTGSSKPTKTGLAVLELQNKLPKARMVNCSATDLGAHGEAVNDVRVQAFAGNSVFGTSTELHTVNVEHGISWEESLDLRTTKTYPENGCLSNQRSRCNGNCGDRRKGGKYSSWHVNSASTELCRCNF